MKKLITVLLTAMLFIASSAYAAGTLEDVEKAYVAGDYKQAIKLTKVLALKGKLLRFMEDYIYPNEQCFHSYMNGLHPEERWIKVWPKLELLKEKAKKTGLWNMFLPSEGPKLSIFEYAKLCEIIGISLLI